MAHFFDDLWRQIFWSSADGCSCLFILKYLGQSEIGEFDVSDAINDDVFRFEARWGWSYSRYMTLFLCSVSSASTICAQ